MTPAELAALKHVYGLEHISDPEELRAAITERDRTMNPLDRAATLAKVGTRTRELEAAVPGSRYAPPTWSLVMTAMLFLIFAALCLVGAVRLPSLFLRVPVGIFGVVCCLGAWRAAARIIYRVFNRRDW